MKTEITEAIELLAAAYIAANPDVKSSDKAYAELLFEFRETFLRLKRTATSEPSKA